MIENTRSRDGFALRAAFFYAASYILLGVHLPFFPVWLQATGFDAGQVGAILAATALLRVISVPVATGAADGRLGLRTAIVTSAMATALGFTALGLVSGPWLIVALTVFTAFVHVPSAALLDAYTLARPARARRGLWTGAAMGIGLFHPGQSRGRDRVRPDRSTKSDLADRGSSDCHRRDVHDVCCGSRHRPCAPDGSEPDRPLWRNSRFVAIVIAASLIQSSHAVYYGFSTIAWKAAGFDGVAIGALWALGVAAEIVLFALASRLPPGVRSDSAADPRRRGCHHPLDRACLRSDRMDAAGAAIAACLVVRRHPSRRRRVCRPCGPGRTRRNCAGLFLGGAGRDAERQHAARGRVVRGGRGRKLRRDGGHRADRRVNCTCCLDADAGCEGVTHSHNAIHRHQFRARQIHHFRFQTAAPFQPGADLARINIPQCLRAGLAEHRAAIAPRIPGRVKAKLRARRHTDPVARHDPEHNRAGGQTRAVDDRRADRSCEG